MDVFAGLSTGIAVNNDTTSKDTMISSSSMCVSVSFLVKSVELLT